IKVQDNTSPVFWDVPSDVNAECGDIPAVPNVTATDNCDENVDIVFNENVPTNADCASGYVIVRTWKATDNCGNQTVATQEIKVQDNTAPELQNVPANLYAECGDIPAVPNVTTTDNCDENINVVFNENIPTNADCASGYVIVRTWKATDDCGNQTVARQEIKVQDNTSPVFWDVPSDVNAECGDIPAVANVTATDNCDENVNVVFNENVPTNADCASGYVIMRTWKATDNCGNQTVATQEIKVQDNTAPEFWDVPTDVNAECGEIPAVPNVTATDNCDENVNIVFNENVPSNGDCATGYTITRKWVATDNCGHRAVIRQRIRVQDDAAPVFQNAPTNITVSCENIPSATAVTATDNCDTNVDIDFNESVLTGDCAGESVITRKWVATDDCGNQSYAIQVITVEDNVAPIFQNVPNDVTVSCDAVPSIANVTAVDNCDDNVTITFRETINELDCVGEFNVRRKWTATDACGNISTAIQVIKARDNTNPVLSNVPADDTVSCSVYPDPAQVTAFDNCDNNVTITYSETVSALNCGDKLVRKWVATDACGNSVTKKQTIRRKDFDAPVFAYLPENVRVSCSDIPVVIPLTVTDNCDTDVSVTFSEAINALACAGEYNIIRTWIATDNCGNRSTAKQVVEVRDNSKPILVGIPANVTTTCGDYPAPAQVFATDDCDNEVTVTFMENFVSAECGDRIIRKWTAVDACGNRRSAKQVITRTDTEAPILIGVPGNDVQNCGTISDPANVTATDDCDSTVEVTFEQENLGGDCGGEIIRKWTATDNCGNSVSKTQRIARSDNMAPVFENVPDNVTVSCDNVPNPANVTAWDDCDRNVEISFNESILQGNCKGEASITRKWIATDNCGNTTYDVQIISVIDNQPPVLLGVPTDVELQCGSGGYQTPPLVSASDNCDDNLQVIFGEEIVDGACGDDLIRKWTATDDCGNMVSAIQRIRFADTEAPVLRNCPQDIVLNGAEGCQIKGTWDAVTAADNCTEHVYITSTHPSGTTFPLGTTTVTYSALDDCGNIAYCSFDVTVTGDFMLHCPEDVTVDCNEDGGAYVTWTPPTGASCCMSCNGNPEITNFLYMGTYGGHRYYCSRDRASWQQAKTTAENLGGHLAVINDAAENQYLTSFLGNQNAFIGLTDEGTEGNFRWLNGDPVNYTNWRADQPNNHENRQHYGQLLNTGKWNDTYADDQLEYIVEIPCLDIRQTNGTPNGGFFPTGTNTITYKMTDDCGNMETCSFNVTVEESINISCLDDIVVECEDNLPGAHVNWVPPTLSGCCSDCPENLDLQGFVYMGTRNGHRYYCSRDKTNWQTAYATCQQRGGYLAVINDEEENAFLTTFLVTQRAYIGLTDRGNEGEFMWVNGDPLIYSNWYPNEPDNNNGNQDYAELMQNGQWNDTDGATMKEYILELPCNDPILIGGYPNGSVFPAGTTTVTYQAADNCGNVATCSFDVTVANCSDPITADYCDAQGNSTAHAFINKVNTTAFSNASGNNQGYADFTHMVTNVAAGGNSAVVVYPGFYNTRRYVYWRGWIDYNQDGDFNDEGEQFFQYRHYQGLRINFTVPSHAALGETRMRLAMSVKGYPASCGAFDYGEVEDYTINVTGGGSRNITLR
ncbi:MAG: lectin-like protein, partial [Saprospiraceae bacterium]